MALAPLVRRPGRPLRRPEGRSAGCSACVDGLRRHGQPPEVAGRSPLSATEEPRLRRQVAPVRSPSTARTASATGAVAPAVLSNPAQASRPPLRPRAGRRRSRRVLQHDADPTAPPTSTTRTRLSASWRLSEMVKGRTAAFVAEQTPRRTARAGPRATRRPECSRTGSPSTKPVGRAAQAQAGPDRTSLRGCHRRERAAVGARLVTLDGAPAVPRAPSWRRRRLDRGHMWRHHVDGQSHEELVDNLQRAERPAVHPPGD